MWPGSCASRFQSTDSGDGLCVGRLDASQRSPQANGIWKDGRAGDIASAWPGVSRTKAAAAAVATVVDRRRRTTQSPPQASHPYADATPVTTVSVDVSGRDVIRSRKVSGFSPERDP